MVIRGSKQKACRNHTGVDTVRQIHLDSFRQDTTVRGGVINRKRRGEMQMSSTQLAPVGSCSWIEGTTENTVLLDSQISGTNETP